MCVHALPQYHCTPHPTQYIPIHTSPPPGGTHSPMYTHLGIGSPLLEVFELGVESPVKQHLLETPTCCNLCVYGCIGVHWCLGVSHGVYWCVLVCWYVLVCSTCMLQSCKSVNMYAAVMQVSQPCTHLYFLSHCTHYFLSHCTHYFLPHCTHYVTTLSQHIPCP